MVCISTQRVIQIKFLGSTVGERYWQTQNNVNTFHLVNDSWRTFSFESTRKLFKSKNKILNSCPSWKSLVHIQKFSNLNMAFMIQFIMVFENNLFGTFADTKACCWPIRKIIPKCYNERLVFYLIWIKVWFEILLSEKYCI